MKKIAAVLLCLMMIFSLFSCEFNEDQDVPSQSSNTPSDSVETIKLSDTEEAMQMYGAAINDEICVFDERLGETKLKSLCFPSGSTPLDECKLLTKAILDVDRDGSGEYVIQSPNHEHIILRCNNGKVYSYRLDSKDFYRFNTDGTFYWYDSSEMGEWECGLSKIVFDGETLNIESVYSLKYSQDPTKYEYFVGGKAVTEDEYYGCRSQNTRKERMKFSQLELTHSYPITAEQAWNLANAYWDNQDGGTDAGAGTVWTVRITLTDTPSPGAEYYRVAFRVESTSNVQEGGECMPPHRIKEYDQILVNAVTGEITASTHKSDGKGISEEAAIEIVKNNCEYADFDVEGDGYRVEHVPDATAPKHFYVIVIQKYVVDHYTDYEVRWVDKNTGESIMPYYLNGK